MNKEEIKKTHPTLPITWEETWAHAGDYGDVILYNVEFLEDFGEITKGSKFESIHLHDDVLETYSDDKDDAVNVVKIKHSPLPNTTSRTECLASKNPTIEIYFWFLPDKQLLDKLEATCIDKLNYETNIPLSVLIMIMLEENLQIMIKERTKVQIDNHSFKQR